MAHMLAVVDDYPPTDETMVQFVHGSRSGSTSSFWSRDPVARRAYARQVAHIPDADVGAFWRLTGQSRTTYGLRALWILPRHRSIDVVDDVRR